MNSVKNNKWLAVLTVMLLIVNVITLAILWMNHKREVSMEPPAGGQAFEFVIKELALTERQQVQYKALRDEHQLQQKPLVDSIGKAKDDFFDLLKDSAADEATIDLYNKKAFALQEKLELVNFKHFQKLRAICDSQQKQKFDGILQAILRRIGGARRPGGPPPPRQGDLKNPPPGTDERPDREADREPLPPSEK